METKLVKLGDIISLNYGKSLTKKIEFRVTFLSMGPLE